RIAGSARATRACPATSPPAWWWCATAWSAGSSSHLSPPSPPAGPPVTPAPPRRERRHELDALRVLAVLALLLYHASRPFDTEVWHLKNLEKSAGLELFVTRSASARPGATRASVWVACSSRSRSGWRWSSCHRSTCSASAWACPTG